MNTLERARELRSVIEQAMTGVDDRTASTAAELYPTMKYTGELIKAGTRINWNGVVKKAAVDLWDREDSNPDNASALWEDLLYRDGIRIIPEVITVTTAFAKDELGWWGDVKYRSLMDANVYTPEQYAAGWELVDE